MVGCRLNGATKTVCERAGIGGESAFEASGNVRLKLRKAYHTGQTEIVLAPKAFLRRLIATIPPRRANNVRFHGVFAPNAKVRPALKALLPDQARAPGEKDDSQTCAHDEGQIGVAPIEEAAPIPP